MKIFLIIGCLIIVSACGVKPSQLSAPDGADQTAFPRTYPAPDSE